VRGGKVKRRGRYGGR